ncbi:hypothetical protein [Kitasatospora cineracea]|uniref:hypothetical protein n=1 Tax=Kitasatospora cineracea TaxID=88074 RepID=UPI0033EBB48E
MKTAVWRWVLSPLTSVLAVRIQWEEPAPISFDEAWRYARVMLRPDELEYRWRSQRQAPGSGGPHSRSPGPGTPL